MNGAARVVAGVMGLVLAGVPGAAPAGAAEQRTAQVRAGAPRTAPAPAGGTARGGADLSVRMEASPRRARPGRRLVYRVRVRNSGPGDAVLPVLTVRLPKAVRIRYVDVAECRPGRAAGEVVCASRRDVPAGGSGKVTITGTVRPGASGPLRATAVLSSQVVDGDETDNAVRTVTPVGRRGAR